ncbi:hypothetical protein JVU11DRAFT_9401 [Chiua virens]|nr:hypothetical protein JVU11DRAFT_9401 [Chiua virens]
MIDSLSDLNSRLACHFARGVLCTATINRVIHWQTTRIMGKSRKRQKSQQNVQPLGARTFADDTAKDDEERRLESMLFGVPYVPVRENPRQATRR